MHPAQHSNAPGDDFGGVWSPPFTPMAHLVTMLAVFGPPPLHTHGAPGDDVGGVCRGAVLVPHYRLAAVRGEGLVWHALGHGKGRCVHLEQRQAGRGT